MADEPAVPVPAPSPTELTVVAPAVVDPAAAKPADVADPAKPADPAATPDPTKVETKPADPAAIVPEKYEFKDAKLPEGFSLDNALLDSVTPTLLKKGFTQAEANELVSSYATALVKAEAAAETQREADFKDWMKDQVIQHQTTLRKEWGTSYDANMVVAQRGMARMFGADGKAILDETGLGNHPAFVRAFHKVGLMVSEDQLPNGALPPGSGKSAAEALYGSKSN